MIHEALALSLCLVILLCGVGIGRLWQEARCERLHEWDLARYYRLSELGNERVSLRGMLDLIEAAKPAGMDVEDVVADLHAHFARGRRR